MPNPAHRRFTAALVLYLAWVIALGAMAITTSKRPPSRPPASGVADEPFQSGSPSP